MWFNNVTRLIFVMMFAGLSVSCGTESNAYSTPDDAANDATPAASNQDEGGAGGGSSMASTGSELIAVMATTKGNIWLLLFPEEAPVTVASFVNLAQRGYYDGLDFHRVIANFMIQGGDPQGNGTGGPGYKFEDEFSPKLRHDSPGVFSMANSGPRTNGSQFFITHVPTPHLDDKHSVFGKALDSQDVVNAVQKGDSIKFVTILGDTSGLLEAQNTNIDKWNASLDRRFPAKDSAMTDGDRSEIDAEMSSKKAAADKILGGIAKKWASKEKELSKAKAHFDELYGKVKKDGTKSATGLVSLDLEAGSGETPTKTDRVRVNCTGWLDSGKKFYSTFDPPANPIDNGATGFVPGFTEAILSMKTGGKRVVIIPGNLGYGPRGNPRAGIPGGATLIFEIELISIL